MRSLSSKDDFYLPLNESSPFLGSELEKKGTMLNKAISRQ